MPPSPLLYEQQRGGRGRLVSSDSFFRAVCREIITTASLSEYDDDDDKIKSNTAVKNAVETAKEERDDGDDMYDHDRRFWYDGEHTFLEGKEKTRGYTASAVVSAHKMGVGERC